MWWWLCLMTSQWVMTSQWGDDVTMGDDHVTMGVKIEMLGVTMEMVMLGVTMEIVIEGGGGRCGGSSSRVPTLIVYIFFGVPMGDIFFF